MANDVFTTKNNVQILFTTPNPNTFIWSVSTWDNGVWDTTPTSESQRSLNCETFDVQLSRGAHIRDGVFVEPGGGVATIKMQGADYDPFSSGVIHAGTPVVIKIQPYPDTAPATLQTIFTGKVESFTASYDQKGNNIITIVATDLMKSWLNAKIPTYNCNPSTLPSALLQSAWTDYANGITYMNTIADFYFQAVKTYTNTTLGQITADSLLASLGAIYCDRTNYVHYLSDGDMGNLISSYGFYFSTTHSTAAEHICMTGLKMNADSRNYPNEIIATYTGGGQLTQRNQDAYDLFGPITLDQAVTIDDATGTQLWLNALQLSNNQRRVESLSFSATKREGQLWNWWQADRLFTSHKVGYNLGGLNFAENYFVTKQIDHITPNGWDITLELWRGI